MTQPPLPARRDEQVEAMARAYDAEDAAQRGEPSPWDIGREDDGFEEWCNERVACMKAALAAASPSAGEGWVLAPREPTEAMIDAAKVAFGTAGPIAFADFYTAMIAAAPPPPAVEAK